MTAGMIISTIFEIAASLLLIYGFINEKKVIAFETALFRAIRIHVRNYMRRKARAKAVPAARQQDRAPADAHDNGVVFGVIKGSRVA